MRDSISQLRRVMGDLEVWPRTDSMVLLCALGPVLSGPTSKKKTQLYWELLSPMESHRGKGILP